MAVQCLCFEGAVVPTDALITGTIPPVVVGVVGIGHVEGIVKCWHEQADINELLT